MLAVVEVNTCDLVCEWGGGRAITTAVAVPLLYKHLHMNVIK